MTTPEPAKNLLQRANAWVGRNVLYIAIAAFFLGLLVVGMANYYGDQAEKAITANPPLSRTEAKKIVAAKDKAEKAAAKAKGQATHYKAKADSLGAVATNSETQADSTHARTAKIPASSVASRADVQRFYDAYLSPTADTAGL